jgi:hypothetical protein
MLILKFSLFFIESQIEIEELNERLEKQLIERLNLEKQMKTLHSENEFSNKKVILIYFFLSNLMLKCFFLY